MHRTLATLSRTLLTLAVVASAGCSSSVPNPMAPAPSGLESNSVAKWGPELESMKPDTTDLLPVTGPPIGVEDTVFTVRKPVSPDRETTIEVGCVRLRIPAGAIAADAEIEVKARPNGRGVELHIYPESLNGFLIPLELQTDVSRVSPALRAVMGWFWIDESTGDWVLLEDSSYDPASGMLTAQLQHFSKYEVSNRNLGKAGW